jgi:glycosidase
MRGDTGDRQKQSLQRVRAELMAAFDYYDLSETAKRGLVADALIIDTVTTMNMATLAAVLIYLQQYPEPTPDNFTDEILNPFITQLMHDFVSPRSSTQPGASEQAQVRHSYKETMFRYIRKVLSTREERQMNIAAGVPVTEITIEDVGVGGRAPLEEEDDEP